MLEHSRLSRMLRSIDSAVYYSGKAMARSVKRMIGLPTFPPKRYAALYAEIARMRPNNILEIGTHDGTNAVHMSRLASTAGHPVRYYGFDLFEGLGASELRRESALRPRRLNEVQAYLRRQGVDALLFPGDTTQTLPRTAPDLPLMDLIFIDGGHSVETVSHDWDNVAPLIHSGTVVYFDDYPNWGVKTVVDAIDPKHWNVEVLPIVDEFRGTRGMMSFRLVRVRRR